MTKWKKPFDNGKMANESANHFCACSEKSIARPVEEHTAVDVDVQEARRGGIYQANELMRREKRTVPMWLGWASPLV